MIREGQNQNESKVTEGKNETLTYFQLFEKHQGASEAELMILIFSIDRSMEFSRIGSFRST